jgi:hypothetical protein
MVRSWASAQLVGSLLLVCFASLSCDLSKAARLHSRSSNSEAAIRGDDDGILVNHLPPASRGRQLRCTVSYPNSPYRAQQHWLDTTKLRHSYVARRDYFSCLSGGRSVHRQLPLRVPYGADVSMDFGVKVFTKKDATSTSLILSNTRNEKIWLQLEVFGEDVMMSRKVPVEMVINQLDVLEVIRISRAPNATHPSMWWQWRAEPYRFYQRARSTQVQSNGVTLTVEHKRNASIFTIFNDRSDHDTAVYVWFDIQPLPGVKRENLWLSRRRPMRVTVMPHRKKTFLVVQPVDVTKPWLYTFNYKWQSGASPVDIFGTAPSFSPSPASQTGRRRRR